MKKIGLIISFALLSLNSISAQKWKSEVRQLEEFSSISISGNAELYLIKSQENSIKIELKKRFELGKYITKVKEGKLLLYYSQKRKHPKAIIYVRYTDIKNILLKGKIKLYSENYIETPNLKITGNGMIRGDILVKTKNLKVSLNGWCRLDFFGDAHKASFKINGLGKIDASELKMKSYSKSSNGLSRVKI